MKPVNLIPARRLIARQRQRHMRRCIVICASWTVVIIGVCAFGRGVVPGAVGGDGGGANSLPARLERAGKDLEAAQQTVAVAREELASTQATLRATRAIADQPDWSTLLALIGQATGDDVMLRTFELQPQTSTGPAPTASAAAPKPIAKPVAVSTAPKGGGFMLSASGLAQSQLAVTKFVLRLEKVGLFSKVTLLDTSREPFRETEATSFRLECIIDPTPPVAIAPASTPANVSKTQRRDKRS